MATRKTRTTSKSKTEKINPGTTKNKNSSEPDLVKMVVEKAKRQQPGMYAPEKLPFLIEQEGSLLMQINAELTNAFDDIANYISAFLRDRNNALGTANRVFERVKKLINPEGIETRIIEFVTDVSESEIDDPDTKALVLQYLLNGECKNRLGVKIKKPEGEFKKEYFNIAIDIGRIALEREMDQDLRLLWLAAKDEDLDEKSRLINSGRKKFLNLQIQPRVHWQARQFPS
jgi:hypothetical protein